MSQITTASVITNIRGLIKDTLKTDGRNSFEYDADNKFKLSSEFISSSTINVYQNGTLLDTQDWSYDSDTNYVTISFVTSGLSLTKGDVILITFSYYAKYSDSEIILYIKSNLLRFVEYRYKKTFYMNDDDEIVTSNGINPTLEEGNIIGLITAVDIDPQNVSIRIPELTISAEQNLSKEEQIKNIMTRFMRSFGTIDFIEDENED